MCGRRYQFGDIAQLLEWINVAHICALPVLVDDTGFECIMNNFRVVLQTHLL